jgi:type IV pilus assembly protein PilY1
MIKKLVLSVCAVVGIVVSIAANAQLAPIPPNIVSTTPKPMIMLNMSKDHQLFYRAYDEFSDLDGDGIPESTYKHSFNYYGYFDSYKCYNYDGSMFVPVSVNTNKYCSGQWSGNFLNWSTMARVDVLRKVLYGGMRSTDTADTTVLERTHLPTDAHAFAKYYKGDDLDNLTPFTAEQLAPSTTSSTSRALYFDAPRNKLYNNLRTATARDLPDLAVPVPAVAPFLPGSCADQVETLYPNVDVGGVSTVNPAKPDNFNCMSFAVTFSTGFSVEKGDQISVSLTASPTATFVVGIASSISTGSITLVVVPDSMKVKGVSTNSDKSLFSAWTVKNLTQISATICNSTLGSATSSDVNYWSHTNTNPPLMRIARGDYQLWNANERWQCYWNEEKGASNGNSFAITGLGSASSNPVKATRGVTIGGNGPDFNVRAKVCDSTLLGTERCKKYPDGNYKPIGLLQEYGEKDLAEFGLLTGSFRKNISGGVIRSNMQSFRSEVNYLSNGTFTSSTGIVSNLNKLRVYGYRYDDGGYLGDGNCTYQLTGLTDNQCTSWGNPLGEMFLESLRYLGGKAPTPAFDFTYAGSKDEAMGLSKPAWVDPFLRSSTAERAVIEGKYGKAQCRAINVLNFNASVTSYDHDQLGTFTDLPGAPTVASLMNVIGVDELITGNNWFVGSNGSTNNRLCTAKTITNLSDVRGICPDGPAYYGSYSLPAMAYWAHTNKIRTDLPTTGNATDAFKVKSYSVALSPGKPRITIPNPLSAGRNVIIQPAYYLNKGSGNTGGGTLVDFRIIEQTSTRGKYLVVWEDSEQGGDYDLDVAGILRYEVVGNKLYVTTQIFSAASGSPQGFGYTISGTSGKDGVHFHSGVYQLNFTDITNLTVVTLNADGTVQTPPYAYLNSTGGCANCESDKTDIAEKRSATRAEYDFSTTGANAGVLQDPMWYAAKWGGFKDIPATGKPDSISKWDSKKADGTLGSDGKPDNYFLAIRADLLEASLRSVFDDIVNASNTAPAVASAQVTEGSLVYQGKFDGADGHGELQAYAVQADGTIGGSPAWNAHEKLTTSTTRQIITNVTATTTVAFTWANLSDAQKTATFGGLDATAEARLDWVRGVRTNEAPNGYRFRTRNLKSIMGAIVNSNPHVQSPPKADFTGTPFSGYSTFKAAKATRPGVIWVGTGDGMLHGFNSSTDSTTGGVPIISYLPGLLLNRAGLWTNPDNANVLSGMEGTPFTGDVTIGSPAVWKSYLFSSLGRGGKGIYALDVTDTAQLTEANASSIFKWQFTPTDDADLGYILSEANATSRFSKQSGQIAKMNNGKFAALFGNGVQSTSGKAALYIMYADGPDTSGSWTGKYVKLVADVGPDNGLSQPLWVDTDGDGVADYIYAGDLKGNVWKFDVTSNLDTDWGVAYSGKPLFIAKNLDSDTLTLPISAVTDFRFHPFGGLVINFATGKAVDSTDFPDGTARANGIFGIWDKPGYAAMTAADLDTNLPRTLSSLALRTFTRQSSDGKGYVTGSAIDWTTKKGWYVKFPVTAEASLSNPTVALGLLAIISVVPNGTLDDNCYGLPSAYLTLIDPITGLLNTNINGQLDLGGGVIVNIASIPVSGQRTTFVRTSVGCTSGSNCVVGISDVTKPLTKLNAPVTNSRLFWREIPTFKTK